MAPAAPVRASRPQVVRVGLVLRLHFELKEVLTAARSPWQSPYVERLIGWIRRDCLDYVVILNEQHLRRVLRRYFDYYHRSRCHLSLEGDPPEPRAVQGPELGRVIELPEVGGLHHRYVREAA